jgi:glycosyltransferase involved in cell wall biosynthesis
LTLRFLKVTLTDQTHAMRIGFDAKRAFHNYTGLGNYSRDIIRLFTHHCPNNEFFLFDPKGKGIHFDYNLFNTQVISSQRKTGLGKSLWRRYGLSREIANMHLDVYHGLSNELPAGIKKTSTRTLVTVHDLIFEKYPEWYPTIDRKIYRSKVREAIKAADLVIAISRQTRTDLIDQYNISPKKIEVVYQGCSQIFKGDLSQDQLDTLLHNFHLPERYTLYVGTIEERKNLHRLVGALRDEDIPLVVVGRKTAYYKKVAEVLAGSPLEKHYIYLENVNQQHLAALYQAAEIFVYPSLYEGFGIPVIEALNCGTPVVTGSGSMAEAGGEGCLSVNVEKEESLNRAIVNLWNDGELRHKLIAAGKEHVRQFTDEAVWQRWNEVYARL